MSLSKTLYLQCNTKLIGIACTVSRLKVENLKILYEDNHLLAVFKPAGLLIQGDRSGRPTLLEMAKKYLKDKYKKPGQVYLGLVHRLDRPVAGVVIFARTSKAASRLSLEFREHRVKKIYWAVVEGLPPPAATLKNILLRDRKKGLSRILKKSVPKEPVPGGQYVELSYRLIKKTKNFALLEHIGNYSSYMRIRGVSGHNLMPLKGAAKQASEGGAGTGSGATNLLEIIPVTGRHHQIRAQLSAFGYPIAGDITYGAKTKLPDGNISLICCQMSFLHPVTKKELTIPAPLPTDFFSTD